MSYQFIGLSGHSSRRLLPCVGRMKFCIDSLRHSLKKIAFRQQVELSYALTSNPGSAPISHQTVGAYHEPSLAVECGPASVIITNTLGEIEYTNPKFTEITGFRR